MRRLLPLLFLAGLMTTAACNTMEGVGQDVTAAGQTVTQEAQKAGM